MAPRGMNKRVDLRILSMMWIYLFFTIPQDHSPSKMASARNIIGDENFSFSYNHQLK